MFRYLLPLLLTCTAAAAANQGCPGVGLAVDLTGADQVVSLAGRFCYLADKAGTLDLDAVRSEPAARRFRRVEADNISLGFTDAAVWLHFVLRELDPGDSRWLLEFDYPLLDRIEVYWLQAGSVRQQLVIGDQLPFAARPLAHRTFAVPLPLVPGEVNEFYVRVKTSSSMQLRPTLYREAAFMTHRGEQELFFGLVYGVMLLMALYNGFLFLAIRDLAYLAYVFAVGVGALFIMALNGHAYQYLWPDAPTWANLVVPLTSSLWVIFTALFTQVFLDTRRCSPLMYRLVTAVMAGGGLSTLITLVSPYQTAIRVATGLALVSGMVLFAASLVCWARGNSSARYFAIAWVVFFSGTAMLILSRWGLLPDNMVTHNAAALGLLVEIVVLSLALSDRYRVMANQVAEHSRLLERRVADRTAELQAANRRLQELAQRDPLTRLANRRRFDLDLAHEWERHRRNRASLALLVCDIDHFKQLNDQYGHAYGDDCLRRVAEAISHSLGRPADLAARFGGDEMVVLLPETGEDGASRVARRIAAAVSQLSIEHRGNEAIGVATLSIGLVAQTPADDQPASELFQRADQALYQAKQQGRNRIVRAPRPEAPDFGSD